jgi:pyruvate dehydrogenase E1 component alpha subunit
MIGEPMKKIDEKTLLALYSMCRLIRRTEEVLIDEYGNQEMRCPMHFCVGQEGAPAALSLLLQSEDYMVSHYRSHGYYLAKGAPLAEMIAEFYGKASGSNGGTAGSMELAHEDSRFFSGAIVGGPLPIAMGMAFAVKYRDDTGIAIAVIGDGALDEGVSYEAINLAALYAVPLLTICENNLYAAHTGEAKRTLSRSLTARVEPFGIRTKRLDGCDVVGLHIELGKIIADIRHRSAGPYFVEVETYRYCGHVGPENDDWLGYRSTDEIASWKRRDPLPSLRLQAKSLGIPDKVLLETDETIEQDIASAIQAARQAPSPTHEWSLAQVWSRRYAPHVRNFSNPREDAFDGRQAETRLKPY